MSELLDQSLQVERDLSRAHWQRTVGTVVMHEFLEEAFSQPREIPGALLMTCERRAQSLVNTDDIDLVWGRAYAVSLHLIDGNIQYAVLPTSRAPETLREQFIKYTFKKVADDVIEEGALTQARFPITLARSIVNEAKSKGIEGYKIDTLKDVAEMLDEPYFRDMVETALLTSNGFWSGFATQTFIQRPTILKSIDPFTFHQDGRVEFSPAATDAMRSKIKEVNRQGDQKNAMVETQSSSGCPARHLRTSFKTTEDIDNLNMLSSYFGKTPEELTQARDKNVVQKGLDLVIAGFEKYSEWFANVDREYEAGRDPLIDSYYSVIK
jgi:hypothetical protein